jgi:hypothetical protein
LQKASADIKYRVRLPEEQYIIKVEHPTLGLWKKTVQVKGNDDTNVIVNFTQEVPIQIKAVDAEDNPVSGEIFVDGKKSGRSTPGDISLRVGLHKISVLKDGYSADGGEKEILIDTGIKNSLTFILKKVN